MIPEGGPEEVDLNRRPDEHLEADDQWDIHQEARFEEFRADSALLHDGPAEILEGDNMTPPRHRRTGRRSGSKATSKQKRQTRH